MYAVTKTYKDFNGVERTETKLFNLTETEVMEMELGTAGGVAEMLQRIVDAKDQPSIIKFFKEFILKAYGVKSADGEYFEKSEEISRKFACTQFYNLLFMELATDDGKAAEFVNHVIPKVVDIKRNSENPAIAPVAASVNSRGEIECLNLRYQKLICGMSGISDLSL